MIITLVFAIILILLIVAFSVMESWENTYKTRYVWARRIIVGLSCIVAIILVLLTYKL